MLKMHSVLWRFLISHSATEDQVQARFLFFVLGGVDDAVGEFDYRCQLLHLFYCVYYVNCKNELPFWESESILNLNPHLWGKKSGFPVCRKQNIALNTITPAVEGWAQKLLKCLQLSDDGEETNEWCQIKRHLPLDMDAEGRLRRDDNVPLLQSF